MLSVLMKKALGRISISTCLFWTFFAICLSTSSAPSSFKALTPLCRRVRKAAWFRWLYAIQQGACSETKVHDVIDQ